MRKIVVEFTLEELKHLKMLVGKDIGWQRKYKTGKEDIAKMVYGKLVHAEIEFKLQDDNPAPVPF